MPATYAAADIGSNTIHLLIAEVDGGKLRRVENQTEWLSLGEDVARTGRIPPDKARMLLDVLREYQIAARRVQSSQFYVFATEAMRAAKNGTETLGRIERDLGIQVDIISPEREAQLSLRGIALDAPLVQEGASMLFEVGGGSAQIGWCSDGALERQASLPLGTGRVIAESNLQSPASSTALDLAQTYIDRQLDPLAERAAPGRNAVASGGVVRGLWRALHPDGDKCLAVEEIRFLGWSCSRLSVSQIIQRFQVKPKRAATLLPGALVYTALLERFGLDRVYVSEFGIREGAILELAESGDGRA